MEEILCIVQIAKNLNTSYVMVQQLNEKLGGQLYGEFKYIQC